MGAVEIPSGGAPSAQGGVPPAPGQPAPGQSAPGQPAPGQPVTGQPSGGQPLPGQPGQHGNQSQPGHQSQSQGQGQQGQPSYPDYQAYQAAPTPPPTQVQPGYPPPPPPESGSRRPWPAPDGAPAPPNYPLPQGTATQWLWDGQNSAPQNGMPQNGTPPHGGAPNGPGRSGGTHPTVILESSHPGTTAGPPPSTVQPTRVQPPALPPAGPAPTVVQPGAIPGGMPSGSDPYGPPGTALQPAHQFGVGGPQPWPQQPGAPQARNDSTLPGIVPIPGGPDQWGQGGGAWPGNGGGGGGIGSRMSGLRLPRPKGPLIPAIGVAAVIVVVAAVIVAVRGGGNQNSGNNTPAAGSTASAPAQTNAAEQQAAGQLAALLPQSGGDRGDVVNAVVSVQRCGPGLPGAAATFSKAASNRRILVSKLEALPGNSNLPPAMIQHLTDAWQASAQADADLAKWAAAEAGDCHKGKTSNNRFLKASYVPDGQATANKKAFTVTWNALARKYSLPTYQWEQL